MPTLFDVADQAGVSYSAVSQILNNPVRRKRFSPKTVARVMVAAEKMGYTTNEFAKSLKTGKTRIIGVVGSKSTQEKGVFFRPYFGGVFTGINEALSERGYRMIVQNYSDSVGADRALELGKSRMAEGLVFILVPEDEDDFYDKQLPVLKSLNLPFVVVHDLPEMKGCSNVGIDGITGGMKVVDHLTDHGFWRNGFVGRADQVQCHRNLLSGFKQAHQQMGSVFDEKKLLFMAEGGGAEHGFALADKMLKDRTDLPESLFCVSDKIAQGMIQRFAKAEISVPGDVAIIGYGNLIDQSYINNGMTTLDKMAREKGHMAGSMILSHIENFSTPWSIVSRIIDPDLVLRTSCGCNRS